MKFIILFGLALAGLSSCMRLPTASQTDFISPKAMFVKTFSNAFVKRLVKEARNADLPQNRATLLPPFDEVILVDPFHLPLDIAIDIEGTNVTVIGEIELTSEGQVVGLGNISDDFNLVIIPLLPPTVGWDMKIPMVLFNGEYRMDLDLSLGSDPHKIIGDGEMTASVTDVFMYMFATLKAVGPLDITKLDLDLGFKNLQLDGGEATIDDTIIDWNKQSENIQTLFDTLWTNNPEVKGLITEAVRCSVGSIINGCTLAELIRGNTDCLSDSIDLTCLEPLFPTPEPGQESTTSETSTSATEASTSVQPETSTSATEASTSEQPETSTSATEASTSEQPETSTPGDESSSSTETSNEQTLTTVTSDDPEETSPTVETTTSGGLITIPNTIFLLFLTSFRIYY